MSEEHLPKTSRKFPIEDFDQHSNIENMIAKIRNKVKHPSCKPHCFVTEEIDPFIRSNQKPVDR